MKKKLILAATMFVLIFVMAICVGAETYGDLTYYISNNEVIISNCDTYATSLTIPSEIDGYPVTRIDDYAFWDCTSLKSVIMSNGIKSIGSFAFEECFNLESITIPKSVEEIGISAFRFCSNLKGVYYRRYFCVV